MIYSKFLLIAQNLSKLSRSSDISSEVKQIYLTRQKLTLIFIFFLERLSMLAVRVCFLVVTHLKCVKK